MSDQQAQHAPVRLLIAETSENAAHKYDSLLRDAGISTRLEIIDLPMANERLADADVMLCNAALPQLSKVLPQLVALAPRVPIIVINNDDSSISPSHGLSLGAADVVQSSDSQHLVLVVKREIEHTCQRLRFVQTRRALQEAEQRCQLLLQSSKAAIAYVHEGMHIYANEGYLKLFGFEDADDLLGLSLIDLLDGDSAKELKAQLKKFRTDEEETVFDFTGKSTDDSVVEGNITLAGAEYEGEHCVQVTVRTNDVAQPAEADPEAQEAPAEGAAAPSAKETNGSATTNGAAKPESGLARNLSEFLTASEGLLDSRPAEFRSIFVAQIDGYTEMQNSFGLAGADSACRQVEATLLEATSLPFMRVSPSQWAMLVCANTRESALELVGDYRSAVEAMLLEITEKTVRPTVTIGGSIFDADDYDSTAQALEATLNAAFNTMRAASEKRDGNHVELPTFDTEEQEFNNEANRVLTLINEAIASEKFVLLFQPIISLRGDSDEHYEVFLRMLDRSGEQMAPNEFLQTAIENGVAAKIDRWVILQSIKQLSAHRGKGHNTRLTINLTSNSVADPEFIQWLSVAIKAARLPSDAVIFQITEQDSANYIRQTREFVDGLKAMHCRASLSRFGVSEEPFEILKHIPVDFVKLEGSLIDNPKNESDLRDDLTEMIKQLQALGKLTIVPKVESANVLSALWQAGANYIQGHYLQEPSTSMEYDFSTDD